MVDTVTMVVEEVILVDSLEVPVEEVKEEKINIDFCFPVRKFIIYIQLSYLSLFICTRTSFHVHL